MKIMTCINQYLVVKSRCGLYMLQRQPGNCRRGFALGRGYTAWHECENEKKPFVFRLSTSGVKRPLVRRMLKAASNKEHFLKYSLLCHLINQLVLWDTSYV